MALRVRAISGKRKYSEVWRLLKTGGRCVLKTTHGDTMRIVNGVKKEKNKDPNRPKDKMLKISTNEIPNIEVGKPSVIEIIFLLIEDTSINNL